MQSTFAVSGRWEEEFDEEKFRVWARALRQQLKAQRVSLGVLFMTSDYFPVASQILELLRVHGEIPLLIGCSGSSLIMDDREIENQRGLVVSLFHLPGATLRGVRFTQENVLQRESASEWHTATGVKPDDVNGWLVLADPFTLDVETWIQRWNKAYPGKPTQGGLASCDVTLQSTQVYLDGEVYENGGVAVAIGGQVELLGLISQGCTPIGETWTITKVEEDYVYEIGNRLAYNVLSETFNNLSIEEQMKARGNLFIGMVVNEYLEDFHRGDFLVRNILGCDPKNGSLLVGALPRPGQTMQFQRRDAAAATEDMTELLDRLAVNVKDRTVYGACLFNCNGRGRHLFGQDDHDASLIQEKLGKIVMTGFFCNGEIGPIALKNFVHGYTASLAVFVDKKPAASATP